jgi:hypothetical protein
LKLLKKILQCFRYCGIKYDLWVSLRIEHWGGIGLPHLKTVSHHLKSVFCILIFAFALSLLPCASDAIAASVTLGWDSNAEPDLEGYVIYRNLGSPGPPYDYSDTLPEDDLSDPLHPKATLTGLQEGNEYYIALTAYNTDGIESSFSNDICVEVINGAVNACSAGADPAAGTASGGGGGGGGGGSCFISASAGQSSVSSKIAAGSVAPQRVTAIVFLLLILIAAFKPGSKKIHRPFLLADSSKRISA